MKNPKLWENYARFAELRGMLVLRILSKYMEIKNKNVLDIGCGAGATANVFAKYGAYTTAIDTANSFKYDNKSIHFLVQPADNLRNLKQEFDIIILQDVLEHLPDANRVLSEISKVLKKDGVVYISTPNRLSPLNFISDPHWNLPFISILSRKWVAFFVKSVFRKDRRQRSDWASLFSLFKLKSMLKQHQFHFEFNNVEVSKMMFQEPTSVLCHPFHLKIVSFLKRIGAECFFYRLINNKFGFFNYVINPTWYIVGWKV